MRNYTVYVHYSAKIEMKLEAETIEAAAKIAKTIVVNEVYGEIDVINQVNTNYNPENEKGTSDS